MACHSKGRWVWGWVIFWKFLQDREMWGRAGRGSDFFQKKWGFGEIGGCFKKWGITYFHTKSPFPVLSFSKGLLFLCFVYLHHFCQYYLCFTGLSFVASDQQMYDYKLVVFEKKLWKVNFWYQWNIQCSKDICLVHLTGGVNIYLYGCINLSVPECAVCCCLCVCVISTLCQLCML